MLVLDADGGIGVVIGGDSAVRVVVVAVLVVKLLVVLMMVFLLLFWC